MNQPAVWQSNECLGLPDLCPDEQGSQLITVDYGSFLFILYLRIMRVYFAFILLLLTALGTSFPCCLHDGCAIENPASSAREDGHSEAACSPFFACATCPSAVELPGVVVPPAPRIQGTPPYQTFCLTRLSTYSALFFQPPRFS